MSEVRYFLAICDELNFTRAAERCGVSQPSLSSAIKRLEQKFGGLLFIRDRNGIQLTELGRKLHPDLVHIDRYYKQAKQKAEDLGSRNP